MGFLTIYTIFAVDIDKGFFNQGASLYFSIAHVVSMAIFTTEIVILSRAEKKYFLQFYFWIDVVSTLTMILELIWVEDLMSNIDNVEVALNIAKVSKASRISRIGARATKIMKLIRLIKLIKFMRKQDGKKQHPDELTIEMKSLTDQMKIGAPFSQTIQGRESQSKIQSLSNKIVDENILSDTQIKIRRRKVDPQLQHKLEIRWKEQSQQIIENKNPEDKQALEKGTKVGDILKYQIQKNIVVMVMGLIIVMPMLSSQTWLDRAAQISFTAEDYMGILSSLDNITEHKAWIQTYIQLASGYENSLMELISAQQEYPQDYNNSAYAPKLSISDLRMSQKTSVMGQNFQTIFSKKKQVQVTSWINIGRSVFITVLLILSSYFFMGDLQSYALGPLQKMNETIEKIEKNPFGALEDSSFNEQRELLPDARQFQNQLETKMLENSLLKITSLLVTGVGETPSKLANRNWVDQNLSFSYASEEHNSVEIFGILMTLQIAHLQKIIENLENQSALYINTIVRIFHETVIENGGYIFNQDETYFLVCWKTQAVEDFRTQKNLQLRQQCRRTTEMALLCLNKIEQAIQKQPTIKQFESQLEQIQYYKQYKVHVGLHIGQAFCGPVGSDFKFEVKAMGTDANISQCLCRVAKKYKLSHLFSEDVMEIAPSMQSVSRRVDMFELIELQNLRYPFSAYTSILKFQKSIRNTRKRTLKKKKFNLPEESEHTQNKKIRALFDSRQTALTNIRSRSDELLTLTKILIKKQSGVEEWLESWAEAQRFYEEGQWGSAKISLQNAKELCPLATDPLWQRRIEQIKNYEYPYHGWNKHKKVTIFL